MGCPDWPLCYGEIIPPMNYHTLIEWGHRTSGALLGLLILLINLIVWTQNRNNKFLAFTSLASLLLVIVVGGIGGAVVLTELEPSLRTLHLFLAQMIIFCLGLSYVSVNTVNFSFKNQLILDKYSLMAGIIAFSVLITLLWFLCGMERGRQFVLHGRFGKASSIIPQSFLGWVHMFQNCIIFNRYNLTLFSFYYFEKELFYNCIYFSYIFSINDIKSDNIWSIKPMDKI